MYPTPPTGIYVVAYNNKVEIFWVKNPEADVKGYNVYNSTTSGGGLSGYAKLNNSLIETYNEVKTEVLSSSQSVRIVGTIRTTVIEEQINQNYLFKFTHENITEKVKQYYIVTAVNTLGEESVLSIEVEATPLVIPTEIFETTTRTQNDISLDYITELLERDPLLDVKPGSVIRQLHVDPNSREMSLAYIREDFALKSQSFLTLRALDDSDNDGISDEVSSSEYKTKLKQAFFLTSDSDVQELINDAFDALSSNYGVIRSGKKKATTSVVFYTAIAPTSDINIQLSEVVSTVSTETQSAIQFITLSSSILEVARIDEFYNPVTRRYEITVPVEAVLGGSQGNVNAGTIINCNVTGVSVTNNESAFGGEDEESNFDLADRAQLAFVGLDVGMENGYKRTCAAITNVRDVKVVVAGDNLMQRDYDELRKKHTFGKVDIYIRGGELVQTEEQVGFLYKQVVNEKFSVLDPIEMTIKTSNSLVSLEKPIYEVTKIRNVSCGKDYDLSGNWMIKKNNVYLSKEEVSVNLDSGAIIFVNELEVGDNITADYQYKTSVTDEVVIASAVGGEADFSLDNTNIVNGSYVIYKNEEVIVEGVDFFLNKINGALHLYGSGLLIGDSILATYEYIKTISNEAVIIASGGETTANLANINILESFFIEQNGLNIDLEQNNYINTNIGMNLTDVINVIYRYRDSNDIVLSYQPVDSILSIVGSVSGVLTNDVNYTFNKIDDVLLEGNSCKAKRSVSIKYANGIPVSNLTNGFEQMILVNNEYRELDKYGIDTESIIVKQGTKTYLRNNDYLVKIETDGKKVQIARSKTSTISNGSEVDISYNFGEVLTITYQTNPLIKTTQDVVTSTRHVTADVLVKYVLETFVDLSVSVVMKSNASSLQVSSDIRTSLSNEFNKLKLGEGIAQSDIIRAIENVSNVKSVVVPLTKMVKADGTQINREQINSTLNFNSFVNVYSYTTGTNALLHKTLGSNSNDGFYAIFEDDLPLNLVNNKNEVANAKGQGFISYDGEIVISTLNNDLPSIHKYTVSYVINGETGSSDIDASSLEFLSLGEVVIITV